MVVEPRLPVATGNETGRIQAFSDGVFAIAITLLILEVRVPHDLPATVRLGVTFVPFPTALLAEYIEHRDKAVAAAVYNGSFTAIALVFNILWWYVSAGRRLLDENVPHRAVRDIARAYALGPLLYFAAFCLAFVNVAASLAIDIGLALFFALPGRRQPIISRVPQLRD